MTEDDSSDRLSDSETVYEQMDPREPYTTGELADMLDVPRQRARDLLDSLASAGAVRKKEPEPDRPIWIREPSTHECPDCGYSFEVRFVHPALSSIRYCPQCGQQL